jgi:serine/threonine protein kinase
MTDDFVGRTLGGYKLEAMLGKGGMATVYRAYQTSVKRYVAIKVMSPEIADQPGFVERFSREAEVIASLEHPHILPVIDYGTDAGIHYLVMRFIEGGSLDDQMRKETLSLQYTARLISQIASALNYAHDRGVIHRDMKPNNVLLDKQENAYITDFGIARCSHRLAVYWVRPRIWHLSRPWGSLSMPAPTSIRSVSCSTRWCLTVYHSWQIPPSP